MAAIAIVKFVLSFALAFALFMIATPLLTDLRYANPMWDDMPTNVLAFGDQMHGIWLLFALVIAVMLILLLFGESSRTRAIST